MSFMYEKIDFASTCHASLSLSRWRIRLGFTCRRARQMVCVSKMAGRQHEGYFETGSKHHHRSALMPHASSFTCNVTRRGAHSHKKHISRQSIHPRTAKSPLMSESTRSRMQRMQSDMTMPAITVCADSRSSITYLA